MIQTIAIIIVSVATVVGVGVFTRGIASIVSTVRVGKAAPGRGDRPLRRIGQLAKEVVGHTRMARKPVVAVAHWFVMVSFPVLVFTLATGYGQLFDQSFALPLIGHFAPWEWLTEFIAWTSLIGIVVLVSIRFAKRPARLNKTTRFYGSSFWQAYYVEATIIGVVACVIVLRGLDYAYLAADPATAELASLWHFPMTAWLGELLSGASLEALGAAIILTNTCKILISMAWFVVVGLVPSMGIAWHRFLAFFNIYWRRNADGRSSLGELQPMVVDGNEFSLDTVEDLDEDAKLGVETIADFTWKGLLDFSTCTECGRCQEQCPAWNTEKPLSPKLFALALRDHAFAAGGLGGPVSEDGSHSKVDVLQMALVGNVIDPDVLWSCTTCGACVEQCPVDIEHVDHIVDLRRYQVLMESAFPTELGGMFKKLESKSNPWGMAPRKRLEWAKGLAFEVPVAGTDIEDLSEVDYLFWVGCAGAYEDRAKRTTRAIAELLHLAEVSFAVLGDGESCTGDPARRAGNEVLFQMLAAQNIEVLNELKATTIVVSCAHCFNTIAREYPQLGGRYEVVHHTQLLNRLVREQRLIPVQAPDAGGRQVTYHDPCYLGRHNQVYEPPRELVAGLPGVELAELPRSRETSFCCGAGGARMWMEEKIGQRINVNRAEEIVASGAQAVVTGCPFCHVMLSDGLASVDAAAVTVTDVAEMLLTAVRRKP